MGGSGHRWVGVAALASGLWSCELVVPQANLDDVRCQQEGQVGPPACPEGKTCLGGRCRVGASGTDAGADVDASVGGSSGTGGTGGTGAGGWAGAGGTGVGGATGGTGGTDASSGGSAGADGGTGGVGEDASDAPPVKRPLGELCGSAAECESSVCLPVPNTSEMRCSQDCCSSFSCPAGTVCSSFWGNQLCVNPEAVGLATPEATAGPAGAVCGTGSQCRSGRCGANGKCVDVCCVNDSCPKGAACRLTAEFGQAGWYCADYTVGTQAACGDGCSGDSACDSNICHDYGSLGGGKKCNGPCCKDADCSGLGSGAFCDYELDGATPVRQCFKWTPAPPDDRQACCTDANCAPGQHCVPVYSNVAPWELPSGWKKAWVFRCQ